MEISKQSLRIKKEKEIGVLRVVERRMMKIQNLLNAAEPSPAIDYIILESHSFMTHISEKITDALEQIIIEKTAEGEEHGTRAEK